MRGHAMRGPKRPGEVRREILASTLIRRVYLLLLNRDFVTAVILVAMDLDDVEEIQARWCIGDRHNFIRFHLTSCTH